MNYFMEIINSSKIKLSLLFLIGIAIVGSLFSYTDKDTQDNSDYIIRTIDLTKSELKFFWKNKHGKPYGSIANVKAQCLSQNEELLFAMNGGMYLADQSPQGLYIENGNVLKGIDTSSGFGNFYLKPNGILYLTSDKKGHIVSTEMYKRDREIRFATQSGPLLLIDGRMHPAFKKGSANVYIRNGVGFLNDHQLVFAMSKKEVNFFDFASFFQQLGCKDALYLDGFVSRAYLPSMNWIQTDGKFGVIIAEIKGN
jgi:uncharacterized protein YigE (DUF2233 family)